MKKRKYLILTLFLSFLLLGTDKVLGAYVEHDGGSDAQWNHPQISGVQLGNGKYVYAYGDTAYVDIVIVGTDGTIEATTSVDVTDNIYVFGVSVIGVTNDDAVIMYVGEATGSNDFRAGAVEINSNSYIATHQSTAEAELNSGAGGVVSQLFIYDGCVYGFAGYIWSTYWRGWTMRYNWTSNALSYQDHATGLNSQRLAFGFQDPANLNMVYLISAKYGDPDRAIFLKWDLDNHNTKPEILAEMGLDGQQYWYDSGAEAYMSLRFLGGSVEWSESENDYFLSFTWTKSYQDTTVHIYQNRLRFNSSGIDADYLEEQDLVKNEPQLNVGFPSDTLGIYTGFVDNKTVITVYAENKYAEPSDFRCYYIESTITDWYNFTLADMGTTDSGWYEGIEVEAHQRAIWKGVTETMMSQKSTVADTIRFYYGLGVESGNYDVTISLLPADDPPYTNTRYLFSGTTTIDEVPRSVLYQCYYDDIVVSAGTSDSAGGFSFYRIETIQGSHNVTVQLFSNSTTLVNSREFIYVFQEQVITDDTGFLTNLGVQALVYAFIPMMVVLIPAYIIYDQTNNPAGFIIGMIIGVGVGVMAGIVPMYLMFLVALGVIMFFIFASRRGF